MNPFRRSKFGNRRTARGFASRREERRYDELALLEMAGKIRDLAKQVTFRLEVNGVLVCRYIADFVYTEDGKNVVEDCKGFRTPEYKLKAKLFRAIHGYEIRES